MSLQCDWGLQAYKRNRTFQEDKITKKSRDSVEKDERNVEHMNLLFDVLGRKYSQTKEIRKVKWRNMKREISYPLQ